MPSLPAICTANPSHIYKSSSSMMGNILEVQVSGSWPADKCPHCGSSGQLLEGNFVTLAEDFLRLIYLEHDTYRLENLHAKLKEAKNDGQRAEVIKQLVSNDPKFSGLKDRLSSLSLTESIAIVTLLFVALQTYIMVTGPSPSVSNSTTYNVTNNVTIHLSEDEFRQKVYEDISSPKAPPSQHAIRDKSEVFRKSPIARALEKSLLQQAPTTGLDKK